MGVKFRPGTSVHVIFWLSIFVLVAFTIAAKVLFHSNPNYTDSVTFANELAEKLDIQSVHVLYSGKEKQPVADKILKISLHLSKADYDDIDIRTYYSERAAELAIQGPLNAGTIRVITKKNIRGGCRPVYMQTVDEYYGDEFTTNED